MQKDLLQKPQVAEIGQHIGLEAGEEMIKRFFDKYPEQAHGNIMGKAIIEKILAQPDCQGITIVPGLDENNNRHVVLVGYDSNKQPILNYNVVDMSGTIVSEEGIIGDRDGEVLSWAGKS